MTSLLLPGCVAALNRDLDALPGRLVRTDSRRGLGDHELPQVLARLAG